MMWKQQEFRISVVLMNVERSLMEIFIHRRLSAIKKTSPTEQWWQDNCWTCVRTVSRRLIRRLQHRPKKNNRKQCFSTINWNRRFIETAAENGRRAANDHCRWRRELGSSISRSVAHDRADSLLTVSWRDPSRACSGKKKRRSKSASAFTSDVLFICIYLFSFLMKRLRPQIDYRILATESSKQYDASNCNGTTSVPRSTTVDRQAPSATHKMALRRLAWRRKSRGVELTANRRTLRRDEVAWIASRGPSPPAACHVTCGSAEVALRVSGIYTMAHANIRKQHRSPSERPIPNNSMKPNVWHTWSKQLDSDVNGR